jgi:hypothetical protein
LPALHLPSPRNAFHRHDPARLKRRIEQGNAQLQPLLSVAALLREQFHPLLGARRGHHRSNIDLLRPAMSAGAAAAKPRLIVAFGIIIAQRQRARCRRGALAFERAHVRCVARQQRRRRDEARRPQRIVVPHDLQSTVLLDQR